MTIQEILVKAYMTPIANYKGMSVNIFGLPIYAKRKPRSIQNIYYTMRKEGYLIFEDNNLMLTNRGREFIKKKYLSARYFASPFEDTAPKNLLVMYDIPQEQKAEREWFRKQLRIFGYEMIQRSVWVGPSPLPKDFLEYVKKIGLKDMLKTFKLAKGYETSM